LDSGDGGDDDGDRDDGDDGNDGDDREISDARDRRETSDDDAKDDEAVVAVILRKGSLPERAETSRGESLTPKARSPPQTRPHLTSNR